ncbi:hypothetical protein BBJ28_00024878, partial [Nothophytophthora sp. Chile5]
MEPEHAGSETGNRDRAAYLAEIYGTLRQRQAFSGEEERMKWRWRLHQLRRQQEHEEETPAPWAAHIASLLAAIENQISAMPLDGEDRTSRTRASSAAAALGEFRLTAGDEELSRESGEAMRRRGSIPIMENEVMTTMGDTHRSSTYSSWENMGRLVRAASGRTLSALTRSSTRDRDSSSLALSRLSLSDNDASIDAVEVVTSAAAAASVSHHSIEEGVEKVDDRDSTAMTMYRRQESSSLGHSVPNLLRSMASYLGLSMEETFLCQICYDYVPVTTSVTLSACGHSFCETCLRNYLEFKIGEAQVYPRCFFERKEDKSACSMEISVDDIQANVSEEVWQKYTKFKFNKENELARQCPYCDHSQICAGSDQPECVCEACHREFCFLHSSAHQGRSCADYDKKMIAVEKLNHALISEISKPCPGCQNNVEKTGGCNQMKCVVCNTSFCWICLEVIDDSVFPEHFQVSIGCCLARSRWWNVRGCAGNQMADLEQQGTAQKVLSMIMRVLFFVIFGPPALLLAVVFSILCCCFVPCTANNRTTFRQAFTTCFCVSGYVL